MRQLTIVFLLLSSFAYSQSWTPIAGKQRFTNGLGIPVKDPSVYNTSYDSALIFINKNDTTSPYWIYKGGAKKIGATPIDTNRLAYKDKPNTFTNLNDFNIISLKELSDTTNLKRTYLYFNGGVGANNQYIDFPIGSTTDSVAYRSWVRANSGNIVDTSLLLHKLDSIYGYTTRYKTKQDSIILQNQITTNTANINSKVNKSDSLLRIGYVTPTVLTADSLLIMSVVNTKGTVTSLSLGNGLSGSTNPITISGGINIDTTSSFILSRQRAAATYQGIGNYAYADSTLWQTKYRSDTNRTNVYNAINANTNNILLRVKYTDTVAMLAAYQAAINAKGVGTITGVTAGTNMTGGGTSGAVTLNATTQISSIVLNNTGIIHTTPTTFTNTSGVWSGTQTLASQSPYTIFRRGSGTGTPSWSVIDTNYFNGMWAAYVRAAQNSGGGGGLTGSGTVSSSVVPLTIWSATNSVLSSTSTNVSYDTTGLLLSVSPTKTATANNQVLTSFLVKPTFSTGGFTGTKNIAIQVGTYNNSSYSSTATPNILHLGNDISNSGGSNLKLVVGQGAVSGYPFYAGFGLSSNGNVLDCVSQLNYNWYTGGSTPVAVMSLNQNAQLVINSSSTSNGSLVVGDNSGIIYFTNPAYGFNIGVSAGTLNLTTGANLGFVSGSTTYGKLFNTGRWSLGANPTDNGTDLLQLTGNINLTTAGNKIKIATGTNASVGMATLASGTVTVSTTAVTASSKIFLTDATTGTLTNVGAPTVGTIVSGTSFVINSTNVLDTSNINWFIIN